ncbi:MAG: hypothetical protein ABIH68_06600 [bacterium]
MNSSLLYITLYILLFTVNIFASDFNEVLKVIFNYQMETAQEKLKKAKLTESERNFAEGIYFFYEGEYGKSLERLNRAPIASEFDWREHVRGMQEISAGFEQEKISGFLVRYQPADRIMLPYLRDLMPLINRRMKRIFGMKADGIVLEIYPDKEKFLTASLLSEEEQKRSGTVAISKFNRLMILSPRLLPYGYNWRDTVSHEYIHCIIGHKTALNIPLYLNEGIARTCESLWREKEVSLDPAVKSTLGLAKETGFIPFEKFKRGMPSLPNQEEVSLAFAEVNYMVFSLIEKYGFKKLSGLLTGAGLLGFENAFRKQYGPLDEFLADYWSALKNNDWQYSGVLPDFIYWEKTDEFALFSVRDFIRLGDRLRMKKEFPLALLQYKKAEVKEPENSIVLVKIAKTYEAMKEFAKAEKYFSRALAAGPDNFVCLTSFSRFLFNKERFEECIPLLKKALDRNPFYGEGYKMLAEIYKKQANPQAEKKYRRMGESL